MSTEKGQSGCPIMLIDGKELRIVGIHTGAAYNSEGNVGNIGTLIT